MVYSKYGVPAATIWGFDTGGVISTYNNNFVRGILMGTDDEGGFIHTYKDGVRGTIMGTFDTGGRIYTYNIHGHNLVAIDQTTDGYGGIWVKDRYGEHPAFYGHRR